MSQHYLKQDRDVPTVGSGISPQAAIRGVAPDPTSALLPSTTMTDPVSKAVNSVAFSPDGNALAAGMR